MIKNLRIAALSSKYQFIVEDQQGNYFEYPI